jgi:hypothetical protein
VIGVAVKIIKIAAGEIAEDIDLGPKSAAAELGRRGGQVRAAKLRSGGPRLPRTLRQVDGSGAPLVVSASADTWIGRLFL